MSNIARALRAMSVCLATVCVAASGSAPTYTFIVGPRIPVGPLSGVPGNLFFMPVAGTIGDLNADGAPDLVIGLNGAPPALYLNNGTAEPFDNVSGVLVAAPPNASQSVSTWGAAVVADVNNDGHPDLAIGGFNAPNVIYLNNGTATPFNGSSGVTIGTQDVSYLPALGDVNGDGFVDLAVANTNHVRSHLYLTQGAPLTSGTSTSVEVGTDEGYGLDTKIADVNCDGKADLILTYGYAANSDPTGIAIYLNNGTSNPFANVTPLRLLTGSWVNSVAIADFDNDGKPDLAATSSDAAVAEKSLVVFLNTSSSTNPFSGSRPLQPDENTGGGCLGVAAADVDGDSRPDLLFSCLAPPWDAAPAPASPAAGAVYLNNGSADPFAGVAPVDIPASQFSGYGRSVAAGPLVANGHPAILLVDDTGANYYSTVLAQDPVAQNDAATGATNTAIQISVLANDSAAPGQTLDAGSVRITTAPQHGAASVSNGIATYQPAAGYSGADSFGYTVRDGLGATSHAATVSVIVQPAPVATNDLRTLTANQSVTLDVLANDTSNGGTLNPGSILITVAPVHGTAVITNGQAVYTPAQGYKGVDAFQYSVQDNLGTVSNVATVSLSVQPPPVAGNDSASLQANQNATINVLANDSSEGGTLNTASINIAAGPAHGTAAITNGQILYTPTAGYSGSDSFQYSVNDNLGATSNVATVSVDVARAAGSGSSSGGGGGGGGSMRLEELVALALLLLMSSAGRRAARARTRRINRLDWCPGEDSNLHDVTR